MRRALVLASVAIAARARAESDDIVARPLVTPTGQLEAELVLELGATSGYVTQPTSLAPDLWWGVAPRWAVGVIHSDPSVDRIRAGASLCVRRGTLECDGVYHGSGLDLRYGALSWLAPRARLLVRDLQPVKPAVTLGALAKWQRGRIAVTGDPYLQIGLWNTDRGNRTALVLPIEFAVQPTGRWALALDTGWNSDLAVWRDGWHVPVALGVLARVTSQVDLGATFGFTSLLGPQNTSKERVVFVTVAIMPTQQ